MAVSDQRILEERAIGQVRERLQTRFASRGRDAVAGVVDRTVGRFTDAPIRDFVPVLVERISHDELAHRSAG